MASGADAADSYSTSYASALGAGDAYSTGYGAGYTTQWSKPIITERKMLAPKVYSKVLARPLVQRKIIQQPYIRRKVIRKKFFKSEATAPTKYSSKTIRQNVNVKVPAKQIVNQTFIRPTVHTKNQLVKVNKGATKTVRLDAINEPVKTRTQVNTKVYNAPAQQIHHHTRIIP